jgi:hypothetical protein
MVTTELVLRLSVAAPHTGVLAIADIRLAWQRVADGAGRTPRADMMVEVIGDPAAVSASIDPAARSLSVG